jgi:hypothetical protein
VFFKIVDEVSEYRNKWLIIVIIDMSKPRITTDDFLDALFFAELGVDKDDEAMELFRGSSIDTSGTPTPRAK